MKRLTLLAGCAVVLGSVACDKKVSPTSPSNIIVTQSMTELFVGSLPVHGEKFYSYTVTQPGTVWVMLASLTGGGNAPVSNRVALGIGIPRGTGCALQTSTVTSAGLVSQLQQSSTPGIYCVDVADSGGLPTDMTFAVRIIHP